jgi:serine/threonine protein kinase
MFFEIYKPENILVRLKGINRISSLCIADFGVSKVFTTNTLNQAYTKDAGTIGYMSPEVANSNDKKKYDPYAADGNFFC